MFQVSVEETFSAGHALRGYQGKCENPHGHNYRVRVNVAGEQLDSIGLLYDFTHLKRILRGLIEGVDHKFLNDLAPFDVINPSAENMAKFFYDETSRQIGPALHGPRITSITVWETDETSATYTP
jgi:6-pyruvoyltetrahydropterin/6-carboxytetrahydropterin synthase